MSQLAGKTLIVTKGTTAESYFEANHPEVKLLKFDQYSDAYQALEDGRGDAFSTDNTEVIAWRSSIPASASASRAWATPATSRPPSRKATPPSSTG